MNNKIKILDCTLRDGGYYTNWHFDPLLVDSYLQAMEDANVDYVEIGFRMHDDGNQSGPFAYCTDKFLGSLFSNHTIKTPIGVMINASDLLEYPDVVTCISHLMPNPDSDTNIISLVRIACHYKDVESILPACKWLHQHKYTVGLNLMQVSDRTRDELEDVATLVENSDVDMLYMADSFGGMAPKEVGSIIEMFKRYAPSKQIGIHAHDNLGLAVQNSVMAVRCGASLVDTTVTGMGRGAGNAATETALLVFRNDLSMFTMEGVVSVLETGNNHFQPLKDRYHWGTNPYYFLSGQLGIHPSYVQELLSDDSDYTPEQCITVIEYLNLHSPKKYISSALSDLKNFYTGKTTASSYAGEELTELFKGRRVLIVGSDPGLKEDREKLLDFIKRAKKNREGMVVVVLNANTTIPSELITARIACHPVRLLADSAFHREDKSLLIAPYGRLPNYLLDGRPEVQKLNYGVVVGECFQLHEFYCTIPELCTAAYALATVTEGGAERIYLAGFNGYENETRKHRQLNKVFRLYQEFLDEANTETSVTIKGPVISITTTTLDIECVINVLSRDDNS